MSAMLKLNQKSLNNIFKQNSKYNNFQVTSDLLNNENLRVAIAQLSNELQVCSITMLLLIQMYVNNIFHQNTPKAIVSSYK